MRRRSCATLGSWEAPLPRFLPARKLHDVDSDGGTWIEAVLARLAEGGASDLVLEPQDDGSLAAVQRLEGVRSRIDCCPAAEAATAIARLKAMARLPAYITDEVQDGRLDGRRFGIPGEIRVAVFPTVRGQRVALRLPALGALPEPEQLGFGEEVLAALRIALRAPDGVVLITGPTGSGKTTTIHALLRELAAERPDRQILSIEDPVERLLPGVAQAEVRTPVGFDFLQALRSALRQDVDVLVVGEIRDPDTARTAIRAALSGHLVVATLHAGRAVEVVPRLLDMGVEESLLLPALRLVLAQRLVRRLHSDCGGAGCEGCHGGWRGRQVLCDLLELDHHQRGLLRAGDIPLLHTDMDAQAAALLAERVTDTAELARVLGAG